MFRLILISLAAAALASSEASDSLAVARFRQDSTRAEMTIQAAQIKARTIMEEAYFHLQRDTAKAGK